MAARAACLIAQGRRPRPGLRLARRAGAQHAAMAERTKAVEDTSTNGSCTVRSQRNSETHTIYWRGASAQPAADHRRCARRPSPHVSRAVAKSPLGSMPCSESLRETPLGEPHDPPTHRGCAPLGLLPGNRPSPAPCLPILQPATESSRAGRMATILVMKRMVDIRATANTWLAMASALAVQRKLVRARE